MNPIIIILRHKKENKKKCSLRGLESLLGFQFYSYPIKDEFDLDNYFMLHMEGPLLTPGDHNKGLFLIDGTWRYVEIMEKQVRATVHIEKRSLPKGFVTAYPRKQTGCPDPEVGLASIEALYIACKILGRDADHLLDHYYWKEDFLKLNDSLFKVLSH